MLKEEYDLRTARPYRFRGWSIRPDMVLALERYKSEHLLPGGFLQCVLENNFVAAAGYADDDNLANLQAYAAYLAMEMPIAAWGSAAKVRAWVGKG